MRIRVLAIVLAVSGACSPPTPPEEMDSGPVLRVPSAPTQVKGEPGRAQVEVSWRAPDDDGGSAVTSYTVTSNPAGIVITTIATRALFSGLINGNNYTFTVTATNAVGVSAPSEASSPVTPATVPSAPPAVIAMAGDSQAVVSWTRPLDDGGSVIIGYLVHDATGALVGQTEQTQVLVTGLENGTSYAFTVTALNRVGPGATSQFSNSITPLAVPGAPTAVTAQAGNTSAIVNWTAPINTGGHPITLYTVTSDPGGFSATTTGATQVTVPGLLNGTEYTFTVRASNSVGMGLPSDPSNAVTPATIPGVPNNVTATAGNAQATVQWDAPFDDGGGPITSYTVTANPGGRTATNMGGFSATVTGLTNGTSYTFTVRATNWAGTGLPSSASPSVIPLNVPSAPTLVTAVRGDRTAQVSWVAPSDIGGTPLLSYTVLSEPEGHTATVVGQGTIATMTGLTNGTSYTFTVTAANAVGSGPPSSASMAVIPSGPPFAPLAVTAVPANGEATVSWTEPNDNGAPIIEYRVIASPGGLSAITTGATSAVISGLSNGTAYTFTVTAKNLAGVGPPSSPSAPIFPATVPGAPTGLVAIPSDGQVSLSWTDPPTNGSPITRFQITRVPSGEVLVANAAPVNISGLTNGTLYSFTVTASNAVGMGPASAPITARPATPPGVPTGVAAVGATGQATISWSAPSSDGGSPVTGYVVTSVPSGISVIVGPQTQATIRGLLFSASYAFRVRAINAAGQSADSAPSNSVALFSPACPGTLVLCGQVPQIAARASPGTVELADLNADGLLDVLYADQNATVTVFRGQGSGSFDPGTDLATAGGTGLKSFAIADFNGDSHPDVAVGNTAASFITVLFSDASSALVGRSDSLSLSGVAAIAAGDFDRDGKMDLLVSNSTQFGVMRGDGTGAFSSVTSPQGGKSAVSGDFDADGKLDVLSLSGTTARISRGNGDGTFQTPTTTFSTTQVVAVTAFDQNRDGLLDVALALSNGLVAVHPNGPAGVFASPLMLSMNLTSPGSILARDLNGDGLTDLVTATTSNASVLMAIGSSFSSTPRIYALCNGLRWVAFGDLTGDQRPDLIAVCPSLLQVFPNQGDGTFPAVASKGTTGGSTPISVTTGDFNGDGIRDVATANFGNNSLTVMLGNVDGDYVTLASYSVGSEVMWIGSADLNGDGKLDLISASRVAATVNIFRGQGNGTFQSPTVLPVANGASEVKIADLNGDGLVDLVVPARNGNAVSIMLANGSGGFTTTSLASAGGPHSVGVGDLNGDGKKDLVVALWDANQVRTFLGNGDGTFVTVGSYAVAANPRSIALDDFNGDGRLDVAVAHNGAASVATLRGNGDGTLQANVSLTAASIQPSVVASDLDADGKVDLLVPNWDAKSLGYYRGRGDGSFAPAVTYGITSNSYQALAEDMNGDGSKDVVLVNSSSTNISVLLRTGCAP